MTKRPLDKNATKSLDGMKLEIGTELGIRWDKVEEARKNMDKKIEHHNEDQETFNPS